ncbi:MAG: EF-hand domain-containing protein [Planctomycetota bacterium]|nr:EF-hand domain-containing protein [Planctomycetota bacterium]
MKILSSTLLCALLATAFALPATAQDREALRQRFDANGEGVLDKTEQAAARAAVKRRLAGRDGQKPGANDSGKGKAQQGASRGRRGIDPDSRLNIFDLNGDGFLSESEKAAGRSRWKEWADARTPNQEGNQGQAGQGARPQRPGQRNGRRQQGAASGQQHGHQGSGQPIPPGSRLALFDQNGDGFLSEGEKAAGRARLDNADFGPGGDDGPNKQRGQHVKKGQSLNGPLKRFDQNCDGKLSEAERTKARKTVQNLRGDRRGPIKGADRGKRRLDQLTPEQRAQLRQRAQQSNQLQNRRRFMQRQKAKGQRGGQRQEARGQRREK